MQTFTKPKNLNGSQLKEELAASNIIVTEIFDLADGTIAFETNDPVAAKAIVDKHNGNTIPSEPTIAEKLARMGITVEDLKALVAN